MDHRVASAPAANVRAVGLDPALGVPLAIVIHIVAFLLAAGADINSRAPDGSTALLKATLWRHPAIVALLLHYGADAEAADEEGWTALHIATQQGDAEIIRLLTVAGG